MTDMRQVVKKGLKKHLPVWLKKRISRAASVYFWKSYSQEGEDMVLRRFLGQQTAGYYVDVGAHHPMRFSNTQYFYNRGWSGINIDATPGSMRLFEKYRPRDINIEAAVADGQRELTFFMFTEPALNSFDEELSCSRPRSCSLVGQQKIVTETLSQILEERLPADQAIDFLSVDVEGLDLQVLRSNDWEVFRPRFVLVECHGFDIDTVRENEKHQFLTAQGYRFTAKTAHTLIYQNVRDH